MYKATKSNVSVDTLLQDCEICSRLCGIDYALNSPAWVCECVDVTVEI